MGRFMICIFQKLTLQQIDKTKQEYKMDRDGSTQNSNEKLKQENLR